MGDEFSFDNEAGGERRGERWLEDDGGSETVDKAREGVTSGSVSCGAEFPLRKETRVASAVNTFCS